MRFDRTLVLNQWALSLFGLSGPKAFDELADVVRNSEEGTDENNVSHMFFALKARFPGLDALPVALLQEYDNNIVAHTASINTKRLAKGEAIRWKYFQYLTLLFVEIYLHRYFTDPDQLRSDVNEAIKAHNTTRTDGRAIPVFDLTGDPRTQLNKIALWNATGSGKTLLMHVNLLQYRHYLDRAGKSATLNRVILLTPNEGLSAQHLDEFAASVIPAASFDKNETKMYAGSRVDVVEVTKLADKSGDKTIDDAAFESSNLVFVDEGHRGASGDTWMRMRNELCREGFSFEYSATFGQAVGEKQGLADTYSRSILFDYSYRWFYKDGFGKDHQILNLAGDTQQQHRFTYLVGGLLSYYEQLKVFSEHRGSLVPFRIEKPLWVFVGSSVTAGLSKQEGSDIVQVLRFLAEFLGDRGKSQQAIDQLLSDGLVASNGKDIFRGRFGHLDGMSASEVFDDVVHRVFNADATGVLHVENLAGVDGEIALRVGTSDVPFGVINVGDDAALTKLCEDEPGIDADRREFAGSLFQGINDDSSAINLLIGSKKFTEGWNSWRVSTMGLLNVGRSEGSQIIQLFGRGVRLRGFEGCLKRSSVLDPGIGVPEQVRVLETLGIFGVNADYMETFRGFLEEEGIDSDPEEVLIPVRIDLGSQPLHTLAVQDEIDGASTRGGYAFRTKAPIVTLRPPIDVTDDVMRKKLTRSVGVNWYPKLQARRSDGSAGDEASGHLNEEVLTEQHLSLLDHRALLASLERFKAERGWHNVNISRSAVRDLLGDDSWYVLHVPATAMSFDSTGNLRQWQQIAEALLRGYLDRFYKLSKQAFELPLIAYRKIDHFDHNLLGVSSEPTDGYYYRTTTTDAPTATKLRELRSQVEGDGDVVETWSFDGVHVLAVDRHVYEPVLVSDPTSNVVTVEPIPLDESEAKFAQQLNAYTKTTGSLTDGWDVKFMRNRSRGSGIGFYEGGSFYPDFVIWLTKPDRQHIVFVDPKGMRNLGGTHHLKVAFHREIKHIQDRLAESQPTIRLHSFLVSVTPEAQLIDLWEVTLEELRSTGVVFQQDPAHVEQIIEDVLAVDA